ncbi:MAG: TonB-dependent receptor [Prolixibacteraceae bacterium]
MRVTKFFPTLLFLLLSVLSFAQKGWIRGTVYDGKTGEFLPGVTILAEGTTIGTITDLDGAFNLNIAPGTYTVRISFISYAPLVLSEVVVKAGEATILENLTLKETTIEIGEAVVTARAIRNTEMAILAMKKNSVNVLDAISSAGLKKTGDSDAASSLKRVTGVSVEGGKYVFVRGLGDRYTKTVLNGLDIPGLDPDRNTLQMDIFPSSIIENMVVNKTFSADLPADFTGGVIDINIKDFPEAKTGSVSASIGYNPDAHFNRDYLTYNGGKTDFLGFDDGTRDIPATSNIPFFQDAYLDQQGETGQRYKQILQSFNPTMAATRERSFMDFGLGASFGNQFEAGKYTLGYTLSFSYKNNTEFYEDAENGSYGKKADRDEAEMEVRNFQTGGFGVNDVLLSGLGGFAVKTKNSKYRIYLTHLQNGQSQAGIFNYKTTNLGTEFSGFQHNLEYNQRSLTNLMLDGKYNLPGKNWEIEWKISPTFSSIKDPDIRFTRYQVRENGLHSIGTEVGFPLRIWRDLEEINLAGVLHLTKKFHFNDEDAKLRFGGAYTYKQRDFIIRNFTINPRNIPLTGDPDELFWPENLWPYQGNAERGITYETPFIPNNANEFDAEVSNLAAYVSAELSPFKGLKAVAGLRVENYIQHYSGRNQSATVVFDNEKVLDSFDLFPTINLIYGLTDDQNLRLSWSKTIARPSFKELSFAQIFDPITGRSFIGGLSPDKDDEKGFVYWDGNLVSTDIQNFDFRWELFQPGGQTVSLSAFYKTFKNPIEMVQFVSNKGSFQPRNVGDGKVIGGEVELRQNLKVLGESFKNLNLMVNYTYIHSEIEMSDTEYDSRLANARTGEKIKDTRDMAGQAPYLINAGLTYDGNGSEGIWKGLDAGLFYNVQGKTLQYVGINDLPDVYNKPFHSLNFNMNKVLGEKERFQIGFKVENLLKAKRESVYQSYQSSDQYFERLSPGTKFEFKLSYSLY